MTEMWLIVLLYKTTARRKYVAASHKNISQASAITQYKWVGFNVPPDT